MKKIEFFIIPIVALTASLFFMQPPAYAQQPRTSQELSGMERTGQLIREDKALEKKITKKREKPEVEEKLPPEAAPALPTETILIKSITISGASLIPEKDLRKIVEPFENKELSLTEMQKVADLITDAYRKKGYITSRAYIPPQKIENNIFEIRVIEGKMVF